MCIERIIITAKEISQLYDCSPQNGWNILMTIRHALGKKKIGSRWQKITIDEFCKYEDMNKNVVRKELGLSYEES